MVQSLKEVEKWVTNDKSLFDGFKLKFRFSKTTTKIDKIINLNRNLLTQHQIRLKVSSSFCRLLRKLECKKKSYKTFKNRQLTMNSFNSRFFFSGWSLNDDSQSTHLISWHRQKLVKAAKEIWENTSIWRDFFRNKSRGLISLSYGTILKHKLSWVTQLCQCAGTSKA